MNLPPTRLTAQPNRRSRRRWWPGGLLCLFLLAGCGEPLAILPGGELGGTVSPAPSTWSAVPETVQLETRPDDPYSVNIWAVGLDSDLYVGTSVDGTRWSGYMEAQPDVRVRLGDTLYELTSTPITDAVERERVANAYVAKYEIDPAEWVGDAKLYRLAPR